MVPLTVFPLLYPLGENAPLSTQHQGFAILKGNILLRVLAAAFSKVSGIGLTCGIDNVCWLKLLNYCDLMQTDTYWTKK